MQVQDYLLVHIRILQEAVFNHSDKTIMEWYNHIAAFGFKHTAASLRPFLVHRTFCYCVSYKNGLNEIHGLMD